MRFSDFGKRVVFAAFDGGEITSDAGVLLLREQARRTRLFERMADCFNGRRDSTRTVHTLPALLAQRVAGIALGTAFQLVNPRSPAFFTPPRE